MLLLHQNDTNRLWKELKKIFNDKSAVPDVIQFNNELLNMPQEIANRFNKFFIESIDQLHSSIPYTALQFLPLDETCSN